MGAMASAFTRNEAPSTQSRPGGRGYPVSQHSRALGSCRVERQVNCCLEARRLAARGRESEAGTGQLTQGEERKPSAEGGGSRDCGRCSRKAGWRSREVVLVGNSRRESQVGLPSTRRSFSDPWRRLQQPAARPQSIRNLINHGKLQNLREHAPRPPSDALRKG